MNIAPRLFRTLRKFCMPRIVAALLLPLLACAGIGPLHAADAPPAAQPRIGVVLSGGGARGLAHIGVLRVLERMRIPVSCIAGTSMGSLVGGIYASGMPLDEIEAWVRRTDFSVLFNDDPPRTALPNRVKEDDFLPFFNFQLGYRKGEFLLPAGTSAGYKFEFALRELTERAGNFAKQDFDRLPIPFRAVATNLEKGTATIFRDGDLVKVMRASMSVPGAIAPVEVNGALHVDGGLLRNLPVGVAREACADVIIAVNLGTPLLPRSQLNSVVGVALQSINLLTEQNVRASLKELRDGDVLIEPKLDGYSSGDFVKGLEAIAVGEAAANEKADMLKAYAASEPQYADWRARVAARLPQVPPVTDVKITTTSYVSPQVLEAELDEVPGVDIRRRSETDFSLKNLHKRLTEIYGRGDFERMDYRMDDSSGSRVVVAKGVEKSTGPNYLKFGLSLATDNDQTRFNALGRYRMTWLNRLGAEWRNDLQLGTFKRFTSEFYQPLGFRAGTFLAPRLEYTKDPLYFFSYGRRLGEYNVQRTRIHLDGGSQNRWGELRAGVFGGKLKTKEDFGVVLGVPNYDITQAGYTANATLDQLDNINFPRDGIYLTAQTFGTVKDMGSDDNYNKTWVRAVAAKSLGKHAVELSAEGGQRFGTLPPYDPFRLGGFQRLSGYRIDQLANRQYAFGRAVYSYRISQLPSVLGGGVYVGGSLEAGRVDTPLDPSISEKWLPAGSLYVGADTFLGPLFFAYGNAFNGGPSAFYLMLGTR